GRGGARGGRRPRPPAPRVRRRRGRAGTRGSAHPGAAGPGQAARPPARPAQPARARRVIAAAGPALDAGRPDAATALADQGHSLTANPVALAEIARVRAWVAMERGTMHRVHEL